MGTVPEKPVTSRQQVSRINVTEAAQKKSCVLITSPRTMVDTRSRRAALVNAGAQQAIAAGGNRGLRRYLGVPGRTRGPAPRLRKPQQLPCAAETRRIAELQRIVAALKAGRRVAVARATAPAPPNYRTTNLFRGPMPGTQWNQYGPAWPSLQWAKEIAVKNTGPRRAATSRPVVRRLR